MMIACFQNHLCAGLMEQWLIEGKFTEEDLEVLMQSCDMLAAGIDTVSPTFSIFTAKHHGIDSPQISITIGRHFQPLYITYDYYFSPPLPPDR